MRHLTEITIILPVFEDRQPLKRLLGDLKTLNISGLRVLILDDGSTTDRPKQNDIDEVGLAGRVVRLELNRGHQVAIAVGLKIANQLYPQSAVLVMDSDGEDTANSVQKLIKSFELGNTQVIAAKRRKRKRSLLFFWSYYVYRYGFRILTGVHISFGNYVLLSPIAVKNIIKLQTLPLHFAASLLVSGISIDTVPIDRGARYSARSRMTFFSLYLHAIRSLAVFRKIVLLRLSIITIFILINLILSAEIIFRKSNLFDVTTEVFLEILLYLNILLLLFSLIIWIGLIYIHFINNKIDNLIYKYDLLKRF
jgi:polyisoprenyl-phosphate glycosyltransferase